MDPEEDVINHKTIKFLRHASALPLANLHLKADLAVSSKNYGSATSKREILCTKCCLKLTHDRLVFKIKKLTKKRYVNYLD